MRFRALPVLAAVMVLAAAATIYAGTSLPNPAMSINSTGVGSTYSTAGPIDTTSAFFRTLNQAGSTNGRSCASCHVTGSGWGITPPEVQARFNLTHGLDPIFRTNDGSNCPSADVSTVAARRTAYSQLLTKGLIRVSIGVPSGADFQVTNIQDPYNCPENTAAGLALFRRPLPSTNLGFLTTVMWDGRETFNGFTIRQDLMDQAMGATLGHAQAAQPPTAAEVNEIVDAEMSLYTAQAADQRSGVLNKGGAKGGPQNLAQQEFYAGINDPLAPGGVDPHGRPFSPVVFTTYDSWRNSPDPQKASIARGQDLFNTFPITITEVAGLNDLPGLATVNGTCTTCHNTPNVGNHSVPLAINIGITDFPGRPGLDISGLPVYTVQCNDGTVKTTTDPGRALISGKCKDVGKTKGPILRGLASRAPYFHNGSAATLGDVVDFYDARFSMGLTEQQRKDLVAFLQTL